MVTNLGGQLVDNIHNCTHLVTDKVGLHFAIFVQVNLIVKALFNPWPGPETFFQDA